MPYYFCGSDPGSVGWESCSAGRVAPAEHSPAASMAAPDAPGAALQAAYCPLPASHYLASAPRFRVLATSAGRRPRQTMAWCRCRRTMTIRSSGRPSSSGWTWPISRSGRRHSAPTTTVSRHNRVLHTASRLHRIALYRTHAAGRCVRRKCRGCPRFWSIRITGTLRSHYFILLKRIVSKIINTVECFMSD